MAVGPCHEVGSHVLGVMEACVSFFTPSMARALAVSSACPSHNWLQREKTLRCQASKPRRPIGRFGKPPLGAWLELARAMPSGEVEGQVISSSDSKVGTGAD